MFFSLFFFINYVIIILELDMEILALIMMSLFVLIVIILIYLYIKLKSHSVSKHFNEIMNNDDFSDYEMIEDDNSNVYKDSEVEVISDLNMIDNKVEPIKEIVPEPVLIKNDNNEKELINVLINNKNYIFLANGNYVTKGEHVKVIINNRTYFGTITKANYMRDISTMKTKPIKLIIKKSKISEEMVPKKKIEE